MRFFIAITVILMFSPATSAQQLTPDQCTQLDGVIRQTKDAANQAEGASSQQSYILQALQQYQALYEAKCQ